MKHRYIITLANGGTARKPILYTYHRTAVELHVSWKGIQIKWKSGVLKTEEAFRTLSDPLLEDAVRKAILIYIVKYGRGLSITKAIIQIDDNSPIAVDLKGIPLIYSMIPSGIMLSMPDEYKSEGVLQLIADTPKSRYDRRLSMLFAFIYARSRNYQYEKFTYLWMTMNALYGYMGEEICEMYKQEGFSVQQPKEDRLLNLFSAVHGRKYPVISKTEEQTILQKGLAWFKRHDDEPPDEWKAEVYAELDCVLLPEEQWAFMTLWLPYKIRCGFFHAERAMPLICTAGDRELRILTTANRVLEQFLLKEIPLWLDATLFNKERKPIVEKLKAECLRLSKKKEGKPQEIVVDNLLTQFGAEFQNKGNSQ